MYARASTKGPLLVTFDLTRWPPFKLLIGQFSKINNSETTGKLDRVDDLNTLY